MLPVNVHASYRVIFYNNADEPTHNLSGGATANLTRNWKADYSATWDVKESKFISQYITVYRDMHCWEAKLRWQPTGHKKDLHVRISIKELPEVKFERSLRY